MRFLLNTYFEISMMRSFLRIIVIDITSCHVMLIQLPNVTKIKLKKTLTLNTQINIKTIHIFVIYLNIKLKK